jgi:hypothetical protein
MMNEANGFSPNIEPIAIAVGIGRNSAKCGGAAGRAGSVARRKGDRRGVWRSIAFSHTLSQALLHMLLKLSDSVARLETLLLISSPQESNPNASLDLSSLESRDMNGTLSLGSQSTADDVQDDRYDMSFASNL